MCVLHFNPLKMNKINLRYFKHLSHLGRAALQKRVMALLRRIEHPTAGNTEVRFLSPFPPPYPLKYSLLVPCV